MFDRDIKRIIDEVERDMQRAMHFGGFSRSSEKKYDGHRVEIVDGDVTEEYLVDGDWLTMDEYREHLKREKRDYDYRETKTTQNITLDLGGEIRDGYAVSEVTFSNGVLDVSFEKEDDESDE